MKKKDHNHNIEEFKLLFAKYKFTHAVEYNIQKELLSSKKKIFIRVLKTAGAFSFLSVIFINIFFFLKKGGLTAIISKLLISTAIASSITYGGYKAVTYIVKKEKVKPPVQIISPEKVPEKVPEKEPVKRTEKKHYKRINEILLQNGKIIRGAIIKTGTVYKIYTKQGIIKIPRSKIKKITPIR